VDNYTDILKELNSEVSISQIPSDNHLFFDFLVNSINWNESIKSRKTASFGMPYNYSGITYDFQPIPVYFDLLLDFVFQARGFLPNNCLINYYPSAKAKMGFHSDDVEILSNGTGIAIFSFGSTRVLRLRNKQNKEISVDKSLENGSFFYMSQKVQENWLHAVLPSNDNISCGRISVTFRKLLVSNEQDSI
jgi:alkylated DNA repair dioxygenase AlkB